MSRKIWVNHKMVLTKSSIHVRVSVTHKTNGLPVGKWGDNRRPFYIHELWNWNTGGDMYVRKRKKQYKVCIEWRDWGIKGRKLRTRSERAYQLPWAHDHGEISGEGLLPGRASICTWLRGRKEAEVRYGAKNHLFFGEYFLPGFWFTAFTLWAGVPAVVTTVEAIFVYIPFPIYMNRMKIHIFFFSAEWAMDFYRIICHTASNSLCAVSLYSTDGKPEGQ